MLVLTPLNNLIIIANTEAGHLTDPIFVQQIQSKGPHDGIWICLLHSF